jgi:hypothetical protein
MARLQNVNLQTSWNNPCRTSLFPHVWPGLWSVVCYFGTTGVESSWNVMAHGDAREGNWRGNWRMEWVASILHTTSEHGVSSITTADAHTSAASSRKNWRHHRFKWTRPFRWQKKSGFCAYAITFQLQSTTRRECTWVSECVRELVVPLVTLHRIEGPVILHEICTIKRQTDFIFQLNCGYIITGIQPLGRSGQRPEFSQATGMALIGCILGKFLEVVCHCVPPKLWYWTLKIC